MNLEHITHFVLQSYLNPIVFCVYMFVIKDVLKWFNVQILIEHENNKYHFELKPYLLLAPFIYVVWLTIDFLFLSSVNPNLTPVDLIDFEYNALNIMIFALSLFLIKELTSKKGIAVNLLGFIYAPLAAMVVILYTGLHFFWLYSTVLI